MVTSTERVVPDSRTAGAHLEALAVQLGRVGLSARVTRPIGRPPTLYVLSPDQPQLEERVMIDQSENGTWWFWWDWSDGIAPATEMAEATESIRRVVSAN